jgi:Rrf2 family protein
MVQLGRHYGKGPASLAEIAAEEDLPRAYLEQLVVSLRDAELVTSTRGAHGGYELSRPPDEIRMSEVLRALAPHLFARRDHEHHAGPDRFTQRADLGPKAVDRTHEFADFCRRSATDFGPEGTGKSGHLGVRFLIVVS